MAPNRPFGDIRRKTRKQYSTEEKIRIVLEGLRGEESIAVPLPASIKIVADEIPALRALAAFLDRPENPRRPMLANKPD